MKRFPTDLNTIIRNYEHEYIIVGRFTIHEIEGFKFHDVPGDRGGPTKGGISKLWVETVKPIELDVEDIEFLEENEMLYLYYKYFWVRFNCDKLKCGFNVFHFINVVVASTVAGRAIQYAANKFGHNLKEDGNIGPLSQKAINSHHENDFDLIIAYASEYLYEYYTNIAINSVKRLDNLNSLKNGNDLISNTQMKFLLGWMARIKRTMDYVNKHRIEKFSHRGILAYKHL